MIVGMMRFPLCVPVKIWLSQRARRCTHSEPVDGDEEIAVLPPPPAADMITPAMMNHTVDPAEPTYAEQLRSEHRRTQQELMALMEQMVDEEDTEQFHYLKRIPIDDYPANPYHLQIVPHSDISEDYFFTISGSGVTLYDHGTAEFTALDQWQREYYLFNEILRIRTFKVYRIWKAFMVWMKFVKKAKFANATANLTKGLFQLDPVLSSSLMQVQDLSFALVHGEGKLKLHALKEETVYKLEDFVDAQREQAEVAKSRLEELHSKLFESVKVVCYDALAELQKYLDSTGLGEAKPDEDLIVPSPVKAQPYEYTVRSQKRNEHLKLRKYIKLIELMTRDTLSKIVVDSAQDVCLFLDAPRQIDDVDAIAALIEGADEEEEENSDEEKEKEEKEVVDMGYESPLFEMEVLDEPDGLELQPSPALFEHEIDEMFKSFAKTAACVPSLSSEPQLLDLTKLADSSEGVCLLFPSRNDEENPLEEILKDDAHYVELVDDCKTKMQDAFEHAEGCKEVFAPMKDLALDNNALDIEQVAAEAREGEKNLEGFKSDLDMYHAQQKQFEKLPGMTHLGLIKLNSETMRAALMPAPTRCLNELEGLLPTLGAEKVKALTAEINEANNRLTKQLQSVDEFCSYLEFLEDVQKRQDEIQSRYAQVEEHYELMTEQNVPVNPADMAEYRSVIAEFSNMKTNIDNCESRKAEDVDVFTKMLEQNMKVLEEDRKEAKNLALDEVFLEYGDGSGVNEGSEVMRKLLALEENAEELKAGAEKIQFQQKLFNKHDPNSSGQVDRFDELKEVVDDIQLKKKLWDSLRDFGQLTAEWTQTRFAELDATAMEETIANFNKTVVNADRTLPANDVVPKLKDQVTLFKNTVPVITDLRNDALKDRHWEKIEAVIGAAVPRDDPEKFTFNTLLELKVMHFKEQLQIISTEATQEGLLEGMLNTVIDAWSGNQDTEAGRNGTAEFIMVPYKDQKDTYILGGIDDITLQLEDSMVTMGTITSSRFVGGIRSKVEELEKGLNVFSETLDEALALQKNWMYLDSIFCAPDIQRQLPEEAKMFFDVDRTWKAVIKTTKDAGNAYKSFTADGLFTTFENAGQILDKVQNSLEDYLEKKRMAFPRFYFLSNDELLEILAQTRDPRAVQPHMGKCFDGIKSLDFGGDGSKNSATQDNRIFGMRSPEGEAVDFGPNLKARGNVENWLTATETEMRVTLKGCLKAGVIDYTTKKRDLWLFDHCSQVILACCGIFWAREVMVAFEAPDVDAELKVCFDRCIDQLTDLTVLTRSELTKLQRKVVSTVITLDVHARDIVEEMINNQTHKDTEFGWQMQLRFYWLEDDDNCRVKQTNAGFWYGYEYMGAQMRLVVTPMTDRCYMTLTGALHLKLGGAPAGPAGTGKTETTKDLAKGLSVQCIVFNCGDNLDYHFMAKFFCGLCQCGAWACFDEFNRINIEVLSVVAQQMISIQNALRSIPEDETQSRFNFDGKEIKIIETFGAFITMNPGYAGRTELPDNLKVLFRPVAMMIPNYTMVAEVMLFSEGFQNAKPLSVKFIKLFKLSSEQLSQQKHYDFGMRAVKSVLVMAGDLLRANPDLKEDVTLIRAMRDSNIPKFLSDDVILFQALISDLFPGEVIPTQDYGELLQAIESVTADNNLWGGEALQVKKECTLKAIQLYETFNVRFGVMLVGPTGGGKTRCYQTLQKAMTKLRKEMNSSNPEMQEVFTYVLNPKCIGMGELYGEFNDVTSEWKDGLASGLMRQAVADTTEARKWIVFDGPVDAIWIESMNTVLDDNRTLCLPNGERVKLNGETMRALFEVQDLEVASPATVSRCGMVWLEPSDLGWRPFVQTWMAGLHEKFTEDQKANLWKLFDEHVDAGIKSYRRNCVETIPSVDINLVCSLCALYKSLTDDTTGGADIPWEDAEESDKLLSWIFVFSYTWSIGGNTNSAGHDHMDEFIRNEFDGVVQGIPPAPSLYELFVDIPARQMKPWSQIVPAFKFDPAASYFSLVVPTMDTVRFSTLLDTCLDVGRSVLFTGDSGVGKTAAISDTLSRIEKPKVTVTVPITFSAQTTSTQTQMTIESKLEKRRKTIFGAPPGKKMVLFVDDLNMPAREEYGAQPPVELLRQFQDFKGFYDREKWFWKDIVDVTLCCACAPPGGGRMVVTPRFFRHFNMLCVPPASDDVLMTIFGSILSGFLAEDFTNDVKDLASPLVKASVAVYRRIAADLLPTPAKSHYTFNLRDISKTFQGFLMIKPESCADKVTATRLWAHECMRVFHDRLIDAEDQKYFKELLIELVQGQLSQSWDYEEVFEDGHIMFGDYLKMGATGEDRIYEELKDLKAFGGLLEEYAFEYNMATPVQMNLVFFRDAMEHISRLARVLRLDKGNAMLVGVGGSGKQSCTRLASHMAEYKCIGIELKKGYNITSFRDDLKALFDTAGVQGTPATFLLVDTQIVDESMLEDVNGILNTGEVPGMYANDEKEAIMQEMRPVCEKLGLPATKDSCWNLFVQRVQNNLHIVLAMSPVGAAFSRRCRLFPSLISCTTIDWYIRWPDDALLSVAQKKFADDGTDFGSEELTASLAEMCVIVHQSTQEMAGKFFDELSRRYYITPKSYLDLIALYIDAFKEKNAEKSKAKDRLENGLNKLKECEALVEDMEKTMAALAPVLKEKAEATAELLKVVAVDQEAAEKLAVVVNGEADLAKEQAAAVKVIADDAQADLDKALPALDAAVSALSSLNKNDITEIKSFAKPPPLVQTTLEAVCILKGEKTDWDSAKKMMGDTKFLPSLFDFDKDNIAEAKIKKLQKYISNEDFNPDSVGRVSKAAKSLCMWVGAMDTYHSVAKTVEPKKKAKAEAEAKLKVVMDALAEKEATLKEVTDKVAALQAQLKEAQDESERLQAEAKLTEDRLTRAGILTGALGDEKVRWTETVELYTHQITLLVGDVFLSASCVSYFGAFDSIYREKVTKIWRDGCVEKAIPCSDVFSLPGIMGNDVDIRQWQLEGLPKDALSTENGILVTRAKRWPLMIDPQQQANNWIKNMEQQAGIKLIKLSDPNFLRVLEGAIRIGCPVLCEDLGEDVDPALEPVLLKAVVKQGGRSILRLGETDVDYDENFRFYMTSKLPNPHYMPELCIKVTLINFTVTMSGLEDQLLGAVVGKERPDLEQAKSKLVVSMAKDAKQLKELEDKTLHLLATSEGNVLDNEPLINTLNNSKLTSGVIKTRVEEAQQTEKEINQTRESYRTVATRGSLIYFVISDLGRLDPMYQYSLSYFSSLFEYCLEVSEKSDVLDERLETLLDYISYFVYLTVSRGLFGEHRLIYSFLICASIMRHAGDIPFSEWNFLLRGAGAMAGQIPVGENPGSDWISPVNWELLNALEIIVKGPFEGFMESFVSHVEEWKAWFSSFEPHKEPLPNEWGDPTPLTPASGEPGSEEYVEEVPNPRFLTPFQKLLLLKVLKPDKLSLGIAEYVINRLDQRFVEVPPLKLTDIFKDTSPTVPVIFILSSGADPTGMLLDYAANQDPEKHVSQLHIISLGQGQGPKAEALIKQAKKDGDWVCLQNCHLATSWLPKMEKVIEDIGVTVPAVHEDFRMWLMSMPSAAFPVATLQSSIKLTNEPPQGVRANLIGTFGVMKEDYFESCSKPGPWKKLVFSLSFFHAMIQERRKFGPLGWNVKYEFNGSDLECSMSTLKMFLDEQDEVPWESLVYVTGMINYGGRVTDDQDRRCLMTILEQYYVLNVLEPSYKYSESGHYYSPSDADTDLEGMMTYIRGLPMEEQPEVFGMHDNALVAYNISETNRIIDTVLGIQPRVTSSDENAATPEQMVDAMAVRAPHHPALPCLPFLCLATASA